MSPPKKRAPTTDALEILHRRYSAGHPARLQALAKEQRRARKNLRRRLARSERAIAAGKGHSLDRVLAEADSECPLDVLRDILLLVDEGVSLAWLKRRSKAERAALLTWAGKVHARVNDHAVRVPPRPACLLQRRSSPRKVRTLDRTFDRGEDLTEHLDLSKARRPGEKPRTLSERFAEIDTPAGREKARQVIRRHPNPDAVLHVTPRDMDVILEALKNPPAPNARLVAAARRYRAMLDRRLAALDQGETVDPATVKDELAARSRARRRR